MNISKRTAARLELGYIKTSPMFISIIIAINNVLHYFERDIGQLIFLFIPSILTISHMYISRMVYKLCAFHRVFVTYVTLNAVLYIFEEYIHIDKTTLFILNIIIFVIFGILALYYYLKEYRHKHGKY